MNESSWIRRRRRAVWLFINAPGEVWRIITSSLATGEMTAYVIMQLFLGKDASLTTVQTIAISIFALLVAFVSPEYFKERRLREKEIRSILGC